MTRRLPLLALGLAAARPAAGQALREQPLPVSATITDSVDHSLIHRKWVRPVGSLLVPGSGQLAAGQSRGLVYLAAERWVASRALAAGRRGRQAASHFRQLAFDVARHQFVAGRVDGPWDYYEAMEKFVDSGVYDANPSGPFTPESDSTTFNGSVWQLARRTFFTNPDSAPGALSPAYQAALRFYKAHAVTDTFRYSWRGARLEQDVYRGEIRTSDDAFRARTNYFGVLVLNHLVSAIDALISLRLGGRPGTLPRITLQPDTDALVFAWSARF